MTKDDATKIARRILDRVEQDRALHLDSLVEEIMAGFALVEPMGTKRRPEWTDAEQRAFHEKRDHERRFEPSDEYKRALEQLEFQRRMERMYRSYTTNNTGNSLAGGYGYQQAAYQQANPIMQGKVQSLAQGNGIGLSGGSVTHHEIDPISGYRTVEVSAGASILAINGDGTIRIRDEDGNEVTV